MLRPLPRPQPRRLRRTAAIAIVLAGLVALPAGAAERADPSGAGPVATAFQSTTRSTEWQLVERIGLAFDTFHPQGLARVGDRLFLSSVEILEPTERYPQPVAGYDRSPGRGVGHLFVMDLSGTVLADIVLGEGDVYHPGGIDSDGTSVYVPVGEYRPDSASIVYRVDAASLQVSEMFRVRDHVGGVVADPTTGRLHGVSWGSRRLYTWTPTGQELARLANPGHFVDYQDCQYAGARSMLCGGIASVTVPGGSTVELGGLALVDLTDGRALHEVPIGRFSAAGHVATRNPVLVERQGGILSLWAAPDDAEETAGTELLRFEARTG